MNPAYALALEKRIEWLEWGKRHGAAAWAKYGYGAAPLAAYLDTLERGETFFMDEHFGRLVDHARRSVPDDLTFEVDWLIRPAGWMYLAEPFSVPLPEEANVSCPECGHKVPVAGLDDGGARACSGCNTTMVLSMRCRAVGWRPVPAGAHVSHGVGGPSEILTAPATQFLCFLDLSDYKINVKGFGSWSYFLLRDGQKLGQRITDFETHASTIDKAHIGTNDNTLHEIRWIYTAMYLMSQRLSTRVQHQTHRSVRRRIEHSWHRPAPPFISVVTLRRLEAARQKHQPQHVDWHWQWEVRGHWRQQWYRKEGVHKPKFIEAFVKGPPNLPFKTTGTKLFVARR